VIDRRNLQAVHPFARLNRLLDGVPAGRSGVSVPGLAAGAPILLSVGEPQSDPPAFVAEELSRAAAGWSRYPPPRGTPAYAEACLAWLTRHYGLPTGMIDATRMILPVAGTREGLFFAALATTPVFETGAGSAAERPAILMPNPFYHVYAGAAAAAGAEPICVPATRESGFLPDYAALPPALLARTTLGYFCSPSNPQGAVASLAQLQALIGLARRYDFTIAFDECYAEIYTETPPPGALQAAAALGGSLDNLLVFHSLSKRSSAPGLRGGVVVGDPRRITAIEGLQRVGGAGVPAPVLAAGTRLWLEDSPSRPTAPATKPISRWRSGYWATGSAFAAPPAAFFCGSRSATARPPRWRCGGKRGSKSCPARIWVRPALPATIPAPPISASPWFTTQRSPKPRSRDSPRSFRPWRLPPRPIGSRGA